MEKMNFQRFMDTQVVSSLGKGHLAKVLLLTCVDYRYPYPILEYMDRSGLRRQYDQFILAGAALGVLHNETWKQTFLDHIDACIDLHDIEQILILEHRGCGAYAKFLGLDPDKVVPPVEWDKHKECVDKVALVIADHCKKKHPKRKPLEVKAFLLPNEDERPLLPK